MPRGVWADRPKAPSACLLPGRRKVWHGVRHGSRLHLQSEQLASFFQFLQCQLRMEAKAHLGEDVEFQDEGAQEMWPQFQRWARPNINKKKWMPYHTVLGEHEMFIVNEIHHANVPCWDERRRLLAMLIFRAHCRSEVFQVQMPLMKEESFWQDPARHFERDGSGTMAMLEYRRNTGNALQTSSFRIIPQRWVVDNDENLALSIALRTQTLLAIGEKVWSILQDNQDKTRSEAKVYDAIFKEVSSGKGLGVTWTKMLMVSMDIAVPHLKLLRHRCEVGVGAIKALCKLLGKRFCKERGNQVSLGKLTKIMNSKPDTHNEAHAHSSRCFWSLLPQVEEMGRRKYESLPRVVQQMNTPEFSLTAVTVQVQLCEWRQFEEWRDKHAMVARLQEGTSRAAGWRSNRSRSRSDSPVATRAASLAGRRPLQPRGTQSSSKRSNSLQDIVRQLKDLKEKTLEESARSLEIRQSTHKKLAEDLAEARSGFNQQQEATRAVNLELEDVEQQIGLLDTDMERVQNSLMHIKEVMKMPTGSAAEVNDFLREAFRIMSARDCESLDELLRAADADSQQLQLGQGEPFDAIAGRLQVMLQDKARQAQATLDSMHDKATRIHLERQRVQKLVDAAFEQYQAKRVAYINAYQELLVGEKALRHQRAKDPEQEVSLLMEQELQGLDDLLRSRASVVSCGGTG